MATHEQLIAGAKKRKEQELDVRAIEASGKFTLVDWQADPELRRMVEWLGKLPEQGFCHKPSGGRHRD